MTFEPHPVALLYPDKAPGVLTPLEIKKQLLSEYGVDTLLIIKDSAAMLKLSPADFVRHFLIRFIKPSVVVEGHDFNFGSQRSGSVDSLRTLGRSSGFSVEVIPQQEIKITTGRFVRASSTIIRYMLQSSHVKDASIVLGHNYQLAGEIISGKGKGRQLGFPTLNIKKPSQIIPAEGVYTGYVRLGKTEKEVVTRPEKKPAVFSIGQTRTFGDRHPLLLEAHILDKFEGEGDNKWMMMEFVRFMRTQHKFNNEIELASQIEEDCRQAREILESENK
jgi:riboflavin kinase/FMN adenylyltransferase